MIDVSSKKETFRRARASGKIYVGKEVFDLIKNKEMQEKLLPFSWNQQQIVQASHLFVICIQDHYTSKEVENYFQLVQKIRNTTDDIINPYKKLLTTEIEKKTQEELFNTNKNQA